MAYWFCRQKILQRINKRQRFHIDDCHSRCRNFVFATGCYVFRNIFFDSSVNNLRIFGLFHNHVAGKLQIFWISISLGAMRWSQQKLQLHDFGLSDIRKGFHSFCEDCLLFVELGVHSGFHCLGFSNFYIFFLISIF